MFGLDVLNAALVSEIFPTLTRATATAVVVVVQVIGTVIGIVVEGAIYQKTRDHWRSTTLVSLPGFVCVGLVWLLPESAFSNLDDSEHPDGIQMEQRGIT
eukprot:1317140-Amorphochlora_amoeboformis.AAC.1